MRKYLALAVTAVLLVAGCASDDDPPAAGPDTTAAEGEPTGPAPGVTDDAIKVGVTYVDLEAIRELTNIDHGDYEAAYRALIDDLNEKGGINGRRVELVFAPVNPLGEGPAEEACVKLTQDEQVFVTLGYFQDDNVLCHLETQESAVIGGAMNEDRLRRAAAPWFTTVAGSDLEADVIRALVEAGELDGTVGIVANLGSEANLQAAEGILADTDVEVETSAVIDAPADDVTAQNAAVGVIAERFRAAGVDQVLVIGGAGLTFANGLEQTNYRPELRFTSTDGINAYVGDEAGRDLSVLEGAGAGAQNPAFDEEGMQECLQIQRDAGLTIIDPDDVEDGQPAQFVASSNACTNVALFRAIAEAAGENLNYGTFRKAGEELGEIAIPGFDEPFTYGPPPAADGDAPVTIYDWDPAEEEFVAREG